MRKLFYTTAVSTLFILLSGLDVLAQQLTSACPPNGEAQHWDKIVFKILKDQSNTIPPEFLGVDLDLKILDPPGTVVNLDQEVRTALADRFVLTDFDADRLNIDIIDVKYQIVTCAFTGPQGQQGVQGIQGSQGPPGPPTVVSVIGVDGPQGIQGPPGAAGSIDLSKIVQFNAVNVFQVSCLGTTTTVLGGGADCDNNSVLHKSFPTVSGWFSDCTNSFTVPVTFVPPSIVFVICIGP